MTRMPIPVGPFDLLQPIARGGMAVVWRARHREQGVPVAVKVMDGTVATYDGFVRRFRDEVRAVAGLDHAGVVMVLDHGVIDSHAAGMSEKLTVGCPWLAMEYCGGGTLVDLRRPLPWSAVQTILLAILDALGHAHARDVIHRDLKPANVLIGTRRDARAGLKLSDFGIAWAGEHADDIGGDSIMGTPRFMAPEQITAAWRDQGPWTDLYSLGCLTHWLVTGKTPFKGVNVPSTLVMHMHSPPPKLRAQMPIPVGLDAWVQQLLAKSPAERFQRAADAAWALAQLGDPPAGVRNPSIADKEFQETLDDTDLSLGEGWRLSLSGTTKAVHSKHIGVAPPAAPVPESWKRRLPAPPPVELVGAGLSLYGLRQIPLVGRDEHRDALWSELREVAQSGRARGVVVRGPAGTGKSRLVQWLSERAHETGAAKPVKAAFSQAAVPGSPLQVLGKRAMGLMHLYENEIAERVQQVLEPLGAPEDEIKVLTAMFQVERMADMLEGKGGVRFTHWREYYTGTRNGLYRLSKERPLVAWFDDVQWGAPGTACAHQILKTQDEAPFPILLVLTVRDEALIPDTYEADVLERFCERDDVVEFRVEALNHHSRVELVRGLLGLEGSLAAQVEERTGGNPLFAVQLVGNWVQEGLLRIGRTGFELRPGVEPRFPDDLHAVWRDHIKRVLQLFDVRVERYLEIAAVLGHEVRWTEWKRACDDPEGHFGDRFPGDDGIRASVLDHLILHRLAVGSRDSWTFVHGMLRESLERTALEHGRLQEHHVACATMLAGIEEGASDERRGRHLLAGGRPSEAVEPLLNGVEQRILGSGPRQAAVLLKECERALALGKVSVDNPQWGRLTLLRARIEQELGNRRGALDLVDDLLDDAAEHGWHGVELAAMQVRGDVLMARRKLNMAEAQYERLLELATEDLNDGLKGAALVGLAGISRKQGSYDLAKARLERAVSSFERAVDTSGGVRSERWEMGIADCWRQMGVAAQESSSLDRAEDLFHRALAHYERLNATGGAAECRDRLSRIRLQQRDFSEASSGFSRALAQYDALGSPRQFACRMRMTQATIREGAAPDVVWRAVEPARTALSMVDHDGRVSSSLGFQLVRAALDADWDGFDQTFAEAAQNMPQRGMGPGVVAWLATIAGEVALRAGEKERGERTLGVGIMIWQMAGNASLSAEVQGIVNSGRPTVEG